MPITFQPAAPFSPNISEQYGQTEQFTRLAPLLEQHQQAVQAAQAQQRAQGMQFANEQANRMQQGSQFAAAQSQERQQQDAQLGQQAAQADAQRQQQQAQHEQQIQAQLDMQRNEFTYKDQLELQRYKNGLSEIENSPNLTPEERQDLRLQFATKIDPMERKLAQSKLIQEKTHNQMMQEQLAQQHIITERSKQFEAQSLPQRLQTLTDPVTGVTGQFYLDRHGDPHPIFEKLNEAALKVKQMEADNEEKLAAKAETGQRKHEEAVAKYQHTVGTEFAKIDREVTHEVDAWAKTLPDADKLDMAETRRGNIERLTKQRRAAYLEGNPPPKPPGGAGGTTPETDIGKTPPPISEAAPPTPPEKKNLDVIGRLRSVFASVPRDQGRMPPEEAEARTELDKAESLLVKWRNPLNMPESDRKAFVDAVEKAGQLTKKFQTRVTPPPPPAVRPTPDVGGGNRGFMNVPRF